MPGQSLPGNRFTATLTSDHRPRRQLRAMITRAAFEPKDGLVAGHAPG